MRALLLLFSAVFVLWPVTLVGAMNCHSLNQEDPKDIVNKPCDRLVSYSSYNFTVKDVAAVKWTTFTSSLLGITDVAVVIEDSSIDTLNLPSLDKISSAKRDFIAKNNQHLTKVNITLTSDVEKLVVKNFVTTGNPKLTSIVVTAMLNSVELNVGSLNSKGDFKIENNPKLTTLNLPIQQFNVGKQLLVTSNKALTKFSLDQLNQFIVNATKISKNENMEQIFIKKAQAFVLDHLEVMKNPKLKTIGDNFQSDKLFVHLNITGQGYTITCVSRNPRTIGCLLRKG